MTTPAPGGPLRPGAFAQLQPSWAGAYGPASVRLDGVKVSVSGQGVPVSPTELVPLTFGIRQAVGSHVEASADIGWVDSGIGLRFGVPFFESTPLVLAAGLRTGAVSVVRPDTYEGSLSLEAYPDLSRARDGSLRLVLAVGVSSGAFWHQLWLPSQYHSDSDAPTGAPLLEIVRPETRLQTSLGLYFQREHASVVVALSPWFLLSSRDPTSAICDTCDSSHVVTDFSQSWGVALIIAPSWGKDLGRP